MKKLISVLLITICLTSAFSVWAESETYKALPTNSKVLVNGKEVVFDAYNINGNNYFKLRDIAMAFNNTSNKFRVDWLEELKVISIFTGGNYTPVGGELTKGDGTEKLALRTGTDVSIDLCILKFDTYNINGNNFFKLRELGYMLDFYVGWDSDNNCVIINTEEPYTE